MFIRKYGTFDFLKDHAHCLFGRVVDIGGGSGKYRSFLTALPGIRDYRVLDISTLPHVDIVADAMDTCLPTASVDSAVCTQLLEHVQHPDRVMAEMARILCPGGLLLVTVPFMAGYHACPNDYYRFTVQGLHALSEPWFEVEQTKTFGGIGMILYTSTLQAHYYSYDTYMRGSGAVYLHYSLSYMWRIGLRALSLFCDGLDVLTPANVYSNIGCVLRRRE